MGIPLEIERKYLIERPSEEMLGALDGARYLDIVQIYLVSEWGTAHRVQRSVRDDGAVFLTETVKRRRSDRTAEEYERSITESEYEELLLLRDPCRSPIKKRRYVILHGVHKLEIDLYPFWERTAVLEIELEREDEEVSFPAYLTLLREVSGETALKNHALALRVPKESELRRNWH